MIGGGTVPRSSIDTCLTHLRSWTLLARDVINAEFPQLGLIVSFSAFGAIAPHNAITDLVKTKLARLAKTLRTPHLLNEYTSLFDYARVELDTRSCPYDIAWMDAVIKYRKSRSAGHTDGLFKVIKHMHVLAPCTSGIEQSFTRLMKVLGTHRLNMGQPVENMVVGFIPENFNQSELTKML